MERLRGAERAAGRKALDAIGAGVGRTGGSIVYGRPVSATAMPSVRAWTLLCAPACAQLDQRALTSVPIGSPRMMRIRSPSRDMS